jgi:hypothetical protein
MRDDAVEIQFQLHPEPRLRVEQEGGVGQGVAGAGRLPRVTQVLALALSFQDMVKRGEAKDYADLARLGGVTRERVSQIMKLLWLAPNIQEEILYLPPTPGGRYPVSELAMRRIGNILSWAEQRRQWRELKKSKLLV